MDRAKEKGEARATMDAVMRARVAMGRAMADPRGMDRTAAVVQKLDVPAIVVRKDVDPTRDGADQTVLLQVVLVDREVPTVVVPAVAVTVPTNLGLAPWPGEWMRSTTSWIGSSRKLNL
ncbi:MAG: hypothetical protein K8R36_00720 [Planctomycetales bacterium]|nr:hypothetical protein [Planctomycetales bacterium]